MIQLIFYLATLLAAPLWLGMILLPGHAVTRRIMATPWSLAPVAGLYTVLLLLHLPAAMASLSTLSFNAIGAFLASPFGTTLNWLHLTTSDLVVGRWIYLETRERPLNSWVVSIILVVCWVFAPLGLILYLAARRFAERHHGAGV